MPDTQEELALKARLSYKASLILYVGLLVSQFLNVLYWDAPENSALIIALLTTVPLLLPAYGIIKQQPRSAAWLCFIVCFYFMSGVVEAWLKADSIHGWLITSLSFLLFNSAMMFTRWQGKLNQLREKEPLT